MKFSIAAIFSVVASAVYAQAAADAGAGIAVNIPAFGQVVNAGGPFTIEWTVNPNPSANIVSIALMSGTSSNLETVIPNILAAPVPTNPPRYVWNIPATVPTLPSYALAIKGDNNGVTYSTYFTIIGAAPGTTNTTFSSAAPVPAASGSASAAGSASASNAAASPSGSTTPSAANNLKTGVACAAGIAGAVALLL